MSLFRRPGILITVSESAQSADPNEANRDTDASRLRSPLRSAVLVLLKEREDYGYELLSRLGQLGLIDTDPGGLYRTLRIMEREGLVQSEWNPSERGPARRRYAITTDGDDALRSQLGALIDQRRLLGDVVGRYRQLTRQATPREPTRRVLVVDDESDMRLTLWVLLEQRGFQVEEAEDGERALAACRLDADCLVVLDQRMPGMTGIDVARLLRTEGHRGRIVLYSAYLTDEVEHDAAGIGIETVGKTDFDRLFDLLEAAV